MEAARVLRSRSTFPHYALEAGGLPRLLLLLLLLLAPPSARERVLVFAATAGARLRDIESAARAVLPHFYATAVHPAAWRVFSACARRLVVLTATPRVFTKPFLRDCLGADAVAGTELATWRGRATGLVHARRASSSAAARQTRSGTSSPATATRLTSASGTAAPTTHS